jgi:hypothetical protein
MNQSVPNLNEFVFEVALKQAESIPVIPAIFLQCVTGACAPPYW